ncbi:HhH-GPD domain [Macleaya cordata]|uniref:Adenine DNA glycosylase n=1 Tax=Macleaya cordata TaxID=56857 RepID=A0A200Q726_MACCD|nr:HhH-GPD domain [Macleaya cordata]
MDNDEEEEKGKRRKGRVVVRRGRVRKPPNRTTTITTETTTTTTTTKNKNKTSIVGLGGDIEDFSDELILKKIRDSLLQWYDQNQRVLPWRRRRSKTTDADEDEEEDEKETSRRAYAVWVSEVMLQQTRVSTVIDYYNRWMEKWPTLHHLAQATQEEVNEMWAGLGYYRRARFLLEGAKMVVEGGGEFPRTVPALRKVRGIGDYTAGAIASIAFNEAVPVVDGNVVRVIARLKAISANTKESETIKNLWKLAGQLVDPHRPGDMNQSLMELGAIICTPTSPSCSACPISEQCHAFSLSRNSQRVQVTDYPVKVVKPKQRHDFCAVCVVEILEDQKATCSSRNNGFLLVKRPDEGLLAGLWEFPSVLLDGEADLAMRRKATDQFLKKSFNLDTDSCGIILREDVGECVHIFTHIRLRMYVELLILNPKGGSKILSGKEEKDTIAWKCVDNKSIQDMGLTSGVRKVYNMIQQFKEKSLPENPRSRKRKKKL